MGEVVLKIIKWSAVVTVFSSIIFTFIALVLFILSTLTVALNVTVIADIIAVVQMWLPFNIAPILLWLFTISSLYLTYKLARFVFDYSRQFLSI